MQTASSRLNASSRFFAGLEQLEMDNRIRPLLRRYAEFDFRIDTVEWDRHLFRVSRTVTLTTPESKCLAAKRTSSSGASFLAIAELAIAATDDAEPYAWVQHIYIDDPISSLDEHNAVSVACQIARDH